MKRNALQFHLWTLMLLLTMAFAHAQDENEIELSNEDLSENLDLEAVAS